jgi:superoxide reductase
MPKVNRYRDYIDRHTPVISINSEVKKGQKLSLKVKVGDRYSHTDNPDHYIAYITLYSGDTLLARADFVPGTLGNRRGQPEIIFNIIPKSKKLDLTAQAYCTKHGLWESESILCEVAE